MNLNTDPVSGNAESLSLRGILNKIIYHWPLFAGSIMISLIVGQLYFRYTVRVYEVKAAIIIKDERKDTRYAILKELDLEDNSPVQEKEMELLKSKSLVGQVVHELGLYVRYILEGRVKERDLYNETPVFFQIISQPETFYYREFYIKVLKNGDYEVIFSNGEKYTTVTGKVEQFKGAAWKLVENPEFKKPLEKDEFKVLISDPEAVTTNIQNVLKVGFTSKSKAVVELSLLDAIRERGKDFLNKLIEVYNTASVNDKNQAAKNTMAFLDERLNYIKEELSVIEKELEQYKSSRGITDISSESQLFLESAKEKDSEISQVKFKLQVLEDVSSYVKNSDATEPMPAMFGIDDAILHAQLSAFNLLLGERERMLATAGPQSPLLLIKEQQIQSSRKAILENLESLRKVFEASLRELEDQSSRIESNIRQIPRIEREFISIKRQQSIKEQLFLFLLQKREEAALTYASAIADSRMVDAAHASREPVRPRRSVVLQICLAVGLGFPFLFIYLKLLLNTKIVSKEDLKPISHIPFLGEIDFRKTDTPIMIDDRSKSRVSEQFRVIRTNLQYVHGKETGHGRVTLITSSLSGEGKSFFAINLAVALAITGRKVILLEMDLRKPKLSKYLKLDQPEGLTQHLVGMAALGDVIRPSGLHESLDVIVSGPIPPNPSEILMSESLEHMVEHLRGKYDDIIIDSAPIGLVADAQIISRVAQASVFVIRHGYSFKSELASIDHLYQENKLPHLVIVLNGVNSAGRYGYGYKYGHGKKYGYYEHDGEDENMSVVKRMREWIRRL